ncbi:Helicase associated domain (HA2) [Rhizoctonia solani]|uniref:Helicase associated domain (HA2) n=1 Tax=Rhizoctonia solani TaxID=456999 RepID=A0A8H8SW08_9AGAM|nr:Helicase associated domain (HA2) [Rhizoctonia solani]QRW19017.1 Helicase associated domain (HA2) [Rhizoctonia solani]
MSGSESIERTIFSLDTELPADSVEFCPREGLYDILVCGTYNLVKNDEGEKEAGHESKKPQERNGRKEIQRIETAAILDMKWSYNQEATNPMLAFAESVGRIQFHELNSQEKTLLNVQSIQVADPSVLCLSIDWNNRLTPRESVKVTDCTGALVVSRSDGVVSALRPRESQFEVDTAWHAHDYEPWVASWNYWSPTLVYSGGDDCKLKGWDTRTSCEAPIFVNKRFEAGVTCVQTHPFIENLMAVGSYDNTVRIFDSRKMTTSLVEVGVGGGAWRVKWHPSDTRKNELLVACMYDGFKVIKTPINESGQVDATFSSAVSSRFDAHTSIAYGVDWHHGSPTPGGQFNIDPSHTPLDAVNQMDRAPPTHRGDSSRGRPRGLGGFGRGGGGGRAPPRGKGRGAPPVDKKLLSLPALDGPLRDEAYIKQTEINAILPPVKDRWLENPKSTVSNYFSLNFGKQPTYEAREGALEGRRITRCTVLVDSKHMITGTGDAPIRKEAEKLAALSGMLQLHRLGLLEKSKQQVNVTSAGTSANGPKLRDGSAVTYEIARQFMDFYCKEFHYDPPEITFDKSEQGSRTAWDATMTVGGRRIGLGYASTKKEAKNNCYIDVTVYLDQCDEKLWPKFKQQMAHHGPEGEPSMAAKVHFIMSDDLDDEIRDLCKDIKDSNLYANRPVTQPTPESGKSEDQSSNRDGIYRPPRPGQDGPTERYHESKSARLREARETYENDPKMAHMRETRRSLPVYTRAEDLLATIEQNDVTICMAATGSGKTTQVPQLILDQMIERGKGSRCNIVCTQPRRIAAISVAERIAKERGESLGQSIGYQVRFEAKFPQEHGNITFCTTGIFLKRMQSALLEQSQGKRHGTGHGLDDVTHILVDEVHERDVDTDLLLVVLKRLLADRRARQKPLKIVLMSATIDPTLFQTYFASDDGTPAPVAEVPGRSFPVSKYYMDDIIQQLSTIQVGNSAWVWREKSVVEYAEGEIGPHALAPVTGNPSYLPGVHTDMSQVLQKDFDIPYPLVALTIAHVIKKSDDGHVLVFLPGWDEMMSLQKILDDRHQALLGVDLFNRDKFSLHLLHSTVPVAEQQAVFDPPRPGVRRIILATNIAETSITIPDVVYVVDTARIKEKRYDPARHMSSLVSAWVGSSNLNQRAGRAGRHRSGEYYGIISKARLATLEPYQLVEMKRTDLTNVVMHVKAINFPGMEVEQVLAETIEPPEAERVASAMRSLMMVGALDSQKNLTSLGRVLLQLPVEVAVGRLVLYGSFFKCLDQALTLAAILTNRDPFMAPIALKQEANAAKERWSSNDFRSDALATLNAYNTWWAMQDRGEYVTANRFCSENFLSKPSLLNIQRIKGHLLQSLYYAGVLDISAGGTSSNHRVARDMVVPPELNEHGDSKPLLAALIAIACQPNFAIRHKEKMYRTREDKTAFIHPGSVNHRRRQAVDQHKDLVEMGERELFAFAEKTRNTAQGGQLFLRNCTRLDPMTYMLFGAYDLVVTPRGLECDNWLPITGNIDALDDVRRLKSMMEACMLRVFDGICGRMNSRDKDYRSRFRLKDERVSGTDEEVGAQGTPLSQKEVKELNYLTGDIVRILNRYSEERLSRQDSRWNSRPGTPSGYSTPPYFGPGTIRMSASGASTPNPGFGGYRLGPRSAYFDSRPSTRPSSPLWR